MESYVMAFDAGTTSNRAILFDHAGAVVAVAQQEFTQRYPKPGWVEHDPVELWATQSGVARQVLEIAGVKAEQVATIGITNQRETTVIWDKRSGKPIMNAIVWQDRRTAGMCDELKARGLSDYVRETTGLVIDAYFSATKVAWMLDHVPGARARAERGELLFGTVDTWLLWKLTGGEVHVTDFSNASRTMLLNIATLDWDERMLRELGVPRAILPEVRASSELYGRTDPALFGGVRIPVGSAIGDQQGALFGQACFEVGAAKNTYGTGSFLLMNTGGERFVSRNGLLTTVAWGLGGAVQYALEGAIFVTGAAVQWLRDELKIVSDAAETDAAARRVADTNGVYLVPAFAGLGAPYWDPYARGAIVGLTRGANRDHIVRATLESIGYQTRDVIECMERDAGITNTELKVDGGACTNNFLMQFQADILNVPVVRPKVVETTARGAAFLAGLAVGFWHDTRELVAALAVDRRFEPTMEPEHRDRLYRGWQKAVLRARDWEEHE